MSLSIVIIFLVGYNVVQAQKVCVSHYDCAYLEPKGYYTCVKDSPTSTGQCACRWGSLETKWGLLESSFPKGVTDAEGNIDLCKLVGTMGGGTAALVLVLQVIINLVIALTIMAAVVSIVIGGYIYMTAGGSGERVRLAKIWIGSAILGIILALLAWLILRSIATNLVEFPTPSTSTPTSSPAATSMGTP